MAWLKKPLADGEIRILLRTQRYNYLKLLCLNNLKSYLSLFFLSTSHYFLRKLFSFDSSSVPFLKSLLSNACDRFLNC